MKARSVVMLPLLLLVAVLMSGCATQHTRALDAARARQVEETYLRQQYRLSPELEEKILALDAQHVSARDIQEVLSQAPAPRIIKIRGGVDIRGGIYTVYKRMWSFSEFLMGMGYPGLSLTNPGDGTYAYSCYEKGEAMAGLMAWFYEREGLRPMLVGHSQGGIQAVKILHKLAGHSGKPIPLWNPLTWQAESRYEFTDPLTGQSQTVTNLVIPYTAVVGAGGITRVMPNQWEVIDKLRSIPDSVEEFTGFCKTFDILGGDYLGYGRANLFKPNGHALVRNVWLPASYSHGAMPESSHLVKSPAIKDWLDRYQPSPEAESEPRLDQQLEGDTTHILWAAEVWYGIKKHWVLELQRMIRAHRKQPHAP